MKTKQEIVENWLPRYTKRSLEEFDEYMEKPLSFDPRGQVLLTPSGNIALTLCGKIKMTPVSICFSGAFL